MITEPPLDHVRLLSTVRSEYGLPAEALHFVPIGFAAVCYIVHGTGAQPFFLKMWPDTRVGRITAARREITLRLTHVLHYRNLYPRVPYPLETTRGHLWATYAEMPFALFPLLPGRTPTEWTPALMDDYAHTVATIHRATPALADLHLPQDTFAIPFETDLHHALLRIEHIGPQTRPGLRALRALVLPHQDEIMTQLEHLHDVQAQVRRLDGPLVLCHTDLGGDNLLVDDDGRVYVLDWVDAMLAPPEYDLQEARWLDVERIIRQYRAAGGVSSLHIEHFAFALLRRFLHDMTVRVLRMLEENTDDKEDADALAGIETWGFAQWSVLDTTLDRIAVALR